MLVQDIKKLYLNVMVLHTFVFLLLDTLSLFSFALFLDDVSLILTRASIAVVVSPASNKSYRIQKDMKCELQ